MIRSTLRVPRRRCTSSTGSSLMEFPFLTPGSKSVCAIRSPTTPTASSFSQVQLTEGSNKMTTALLRLLAPLLLVVGFATPALSQDKNAIKFSNFLCEIDLRELNLTQFQRSEFTTTSTKTCAGTASARNAKI